MDVNKELEIIIKQLQTKAMPYDTFVYEVKATHQIIKKSLTKIFTKKMSWVIVNKTTNVAVLEVFDKKYLEKINLNKYDIVPIKKYLTTLNKTS
jgi:hypothetical protein